MSEEDENAALDSAVDEVVDGLVPTIRRIARDLGVKEVELARRVANEIKARAWQDDDPVRVFAANLYAARKRRGMTQEQVGDAALMSASYYSKLERGLIDPGVRMTHRVAKALGVPVTHLTRNMR